MENLGRIPPRMLVKNLSTDEEQKVQYNPDKFVETIAARYSRISPPALSFQRLVYEGTSNNIIPIELFMSQLGQDIEAGRPGSRPFIPLGRKKFFQSLLYPVSQGASPPQILFIWPTMVSMVARIVGPMQLASQRFSINTLATTQLVLKFNVEEDREVGRLMDEVRRQGSANPTEQLFAGPVAT